MTSCHVTVCVRAEVPEQPLYFSDVTRQPVTSLDGLMTSDAGGSRDQTTCKRRYNLRRLNELPYHLTRCRRTDQLLDQVLRHACYLSDLVTSVVGVVLKL